jgi:hypothetical protein
MAAYWGSSPRIAWSSVRGAQGLARLYPMLNLSRDHNPEFFSSLLEERYPERFAAIQEKYDGQIDAINQKIVELERVNT